MLEHYAEVVDQISSRIETIKATIKKTESYLHNQLRSGAPTEQFYNHYALLETLIEALSILQ